MLRKCLTIFMSTLLFVFLVQATVVQAAEIIDKSQLNTGIVTINYKSAKNIPVKVMISKGNLSYTYNLNSNNKFPLQSGDGEYVISVLENVSGNTYKFINKERVTLNLLDQNSVYLESMQMINWDEDMEVIKKAKELTVDAKDDQEKVTAIYNYIVSNVRYDYEKCNRIGATYIPSIEEIGKIKQGICFDYGVLTAAMLRSVGVPTKLMMGYKSDIQKYHAWNQVYLQDKNEWATMDTTYDSILVQNKAASIMLKSGQGYKVTKEY